MEPTFQEQVNQAVLILENDGNTGPISYLIRNTGVIEIRQGTRQCPIKHATDRDAIDAIMRKEFPDILAAN